MRETREKSNKISIKIDGKSFYIIHNKNLQFENVNTSVPLVIFLQMNAN